MYFLGDSAVKNSAIHQGRRHRLDPCIGKIPRRRKWQPTPVFLPGKSQGQRSLVGYSPWDCSKESDTAWPPNSNNKNKMSLDLSFQRCSGKPLQLIFTSDIAYCTSNCVPRAHATGYELMPLSFKVLKWYELMPLSFKVFISASEDFLHPMLLKVKTCTVVKTLCFQCRGFGFNSNPRTKIPHAAWDK